MASMRAEHYLHFNNSSRFGTSNTFKPSGGLSCFLSKAVVLLLLTLCLLLLPLWESLIVLCFVVRYFFVPSSIAIILMGKKELVALLILYSWCHKMVERLFLAVL